MAPVVTEHVDDTSKEGPFGITPKENHFGGKELDDRVDHRDGVYEKHLENEPPQSALELQKVGVLTRW